ncbi:hypothetical protein N1851_010766 [Merluccius polli]|uniref:Uncharacterized protein n=1 Tax=Merluccius polli TaxID=89951 RepID=A0AA47P5B0_MERPO|nr:hypothetical protein N1851_010766 [Merluccius polli]
MLEHFELEVKTADAALQDCFECTDWSIFREAATDDDQCTDINEYAESVTAYINKCIEDVTVMKTITVRANQKPWFTSELHKLLKARDAAFKTGDVAELRTARNNLACGIKLAKQEHAKKIQDHFTCSKVTWRMWKGIQSITNYKTPPHTCNTEPSLPDALNHFYARFEAQNTWGLMYEGLINAGFSLNLLCETDPWPEKKSNPPPDDQVLILTPTSVRMTLSKVDPRKAMGNDNIPGRVLKACAEQLAAVFTDIFNTSLVQAVVPMIHSSVGEPADEPLNLSSECVFLTPVEAQRVNLQPAPALLHPIHHKRFVGQSVGDGGGMPVMRTLIKSSSKWRPERAVNQIEQANELIKLMQRNRTENKAVRKAAHF